MTCVLCVPVCVWVSECGKWKISDKVWTLKASTVTSTHRPEGRTPSHTSCCTCAYEGNFPQTNTQMGCRDSCTSCRYWTNNPTADNWIDYILNKKNTNSAFYLHQNEHTQYVLTTYWVHGKTCSVAQVAKSSRYLSENTFHLCRKCHTCCYRWLIPVIWPVN